MANRNTNPGIGESVDFGVMHNPDASRARTRTRVPRNAYATPSCADASRARTRTRVVCHTGILIISH